MYKLALTITLAIGLCLLTSCYRPLKGDTTTLSGLKKYSTSPYRGKPKKGKNGIRRAAVQETALSLGAQAGLSYRAKQINARLKHESRKLDLTYNFQALLLQHNVVPPVLSQGDNTLNLADANTLRISDRTFKIEKQARFVTTAPHWQDYLWLNYKEPEPPHDTLLPKNREEQTIWNDFVTRGWQQGIKQADTILTDNLARLTRDFKGMVLYKKLLAQDMVSPPYVAKTELGVTGDGSKLNINDQVLRIAALPALNPNSKAWRPALSEEDAKLHGHKTTPAAYGK